MVKHKRYLFSHSFISTDHLCIGKHWEVLFLNMFVSLSDLSVLNHSIYYPQYFHDLNNYLFEPWFLHVENKNATCLYLKVIMRKRK